MLSDSTDAEDSLLLWRCMDEMLQSLSRQAQQASHESLGFVKMSLVQVSRLMFHGPTMA